MIDPVARRRSSYGAAGLLLLFVALIAVRASVIFDATSSVAECPLCMAATAAQQDAPLLAALLAFAGLAFLFHRYWLQLPWLLLGIALVVLYAIDIGVTKTLSQRLLLFDVLKFGKEVGAISKFSETFLSTASGKIELICAVAILLILIPALLPRPRRIGVALTCFAAAIILTLAGQWRPLTMQYIHYELLQNFIEANLDMRGIDKRYSAAFTKKLAAEYSPPAPVCTQGQSRRPDIIVLAVESLSMHQSQLFGGFRNLTPHLDAIAHDHTFFPNFIANGFTTDGGMIAMITGQPPVPLVGRYQNFEAFKGYDDPQGAIPRIVHAQGYTTHFFTTGDINFLDKPEWLRALGFDSWEGAEQPFYAGWKRYIFNAAEDKALYLRLLQWLDARGEDHKPWFAFLLAVSTHPPFINPQTEQPDEPGVFRYADTQIGMFYDELVKRGFFRNGILMILGDHRSMTPLFAAEKMRFGDSALARVPLVVVTDLPIPKGAVDARFSQADFPASIADLIDPQSCRPPDRGVFLRSDPQPPSYVVHARGDRRNDVDVFFADKQAQIVLNGDASHWQGPKPADWQRIENGILLDRIRRGAVEENAIDTVVKLREPPKPASVHAQ